MNKYTPEKSGNVRYESKPIIRLLTVQNKRRYNFGYGRIHYSTLSPFDPSLFDLSSHFWTVSRYERQKEAFKVIAWFIL